MIPNHLTPHELRKEADRRDLVERARYVAERRVARNQIVAHLLLLSSDDISNAGAIQVMKTAMAVLLRDEIDDRKKSPTQGEVNLAGPDGWMNAWDVPKVTPHPALMRLEQSPCDWITLQRAKE